jgi:hypothetical protein
MIDQRFVFLAITLNGLGAVTYLSGTIRGTVAPNRVTWFLWAVAPLIAFWAQLVEGVGLPALMTFMTGFAPLLIFIASFINKKSAWQLGRLDIICGFLSVVGLGLWFVTRTGTVAIVFSIVADALAAWPTIVKAYRFPATENHRLFLLSSLSAIITLMTLDRWDVASAAFPLYILGLSGMLFVLIRFNAQVRGVVGGAGSRRSTR